MQFNTITGELNAKNSIITRECIEGWVPYYNIDGKYVGYKFTGFKTKYRLPKYEMVNTYEELDW